MAALGGLLLAAVSAGAEAGTFTAFGPQTFVRQSGTPVVVTRTFSVLNPATTYVLRVQNGGLEDEEYDKVASTVIKVNGTVIVSPGDINPTIAVIEKPVTLQATNELSVEVRGKPGGALAVLVIGTDNDLPTITASATPGPNAAGWNRTDVVVSFTCDDATSGIAVCPSPVTVTVEGRDQVITGTATDRAGNTASASVTLHLDRTAPALVASLSPRANAEGWNSTDVQVAFTCTDALSGVETCPTGQTLTAEGANQAVSGTATDRAGNSATAAASIAIDKTTPTIAASATPGPNAAGWNNSDVQVSFACADGLSGVATCAPPVSVTTEGAGQNASGQAVDRAGNTATASATVNLDESPPVVTAAATPEPNAAGWNNSDVAVTFTCTDSISGVASCPAPATLTSEGTGQTIPGTAVDLAGNTASASRTVDIDRTPPVISPTLSPAPNAAGWNKTDVQVSFACSDGLSGVASCAPAVSVTTEGGGQSVSGQARDRAGNTATASSRISLDKRPPVVTAAATPEPNAAGWNNTEVTVSFACADALSGIAACPAETTLTSEGADQTIPGTAVDLAGNSASASKMVRIDKSPPLVTPALSPLPNAAGWNRTDVTVSFACTDALSGVATCTPPSTLTTEGARQAVPGEAMDNAGNRAAASASVSSDKTAPSVAITNPASETVRRLPIVELSGTASDTNALASLEVNGQPLPATSPWRTSVTLAQGTQTLVATATDVADNTSSASVDVTFSVPPAVKITSPTDLQPFGTTPVTVSGTLDRPASVVVGVEKIPTTVSGNTWTAEFVPLREGGNVLTAVATDAQGNVGTDSVTVVLDTIAPRVLIDSPTNGSVTTDERITVSGRVNDIVMGTVNSGQASVTVNGITAEVANRTFLAKDVPLSPGLNTITAVAVDAVGNQDQQEVGVQRETVPGPRIAVFSGGSQSVPIGQPLPQPLVVQLTDNAAPLAGRQVIFRVFENNGTLTDGTQTARGLVATTDAEGKASVNYTVGTRAGVGNNRVEATSAGIVGAAVFAASATLHPPAKINVDSGSLQRGIPGQPLPRPFVAVITDDGHNRLPNIPVTFKIEEGGGDFSGQTEVTATTDPDGRAIAVLTLGPSPGVESNLVSATVENLSGLPAAFSATALDPGDPANTRISGTVLDNQNEALLGVTLRIRNTAISAQTNDQGQFLLTGVPAGDVHLEVDGSTTQRPGNYPNLEFEIVTVPGALNTVGMPIYLLPLDLQNAIFVDETQGGTLTLPDYPGFSLTVAPNSATFPDGTRRGTVSVTVVHSDKVPMVPNFGQQPRFIVTIQPPGVKFEPPARITHPNVDGLKPGEVTELYSFDHDMGSFVATGTAHVSNDGTQIVSDPGTGIIKGGWHCGGNPSPAGTCADCGNPGNCKKPGGTGCVNDDTQVPPDTTEPGDCKTMVCKGGKPQPVAFDDPPENEDKTDCTRPICTPSGNPDEEPDDSEIPPPDPSKEIPTDCLRWGCKEGKPGLVNDDRETPAQDAAGNCTRMICQDGKPVPDRYDADVPADPPDNCQRGDCKLGTPGTQADDGDRQQRSPVDCLRETCTNGVPGVQRDYSEPGCQPPNGRSCPSTGAPVQLITGNVYFDNTDGALAGLGGLVFTRSYNSMRAWLGEGGGFGPGWAHPFERAVVVLPNGSIRLDRADGTEVYFADRGAGRFEPTQGMYGRTFMDRSGDRITHTLRSGAKEIYDGAGRLVAGTDPLGNITTYQRDGGGRLVRVTAASGRSFSLTYNASGHIADLSGPDGVLASYGYDAGGLLSQVSYPDGSGYSFSYDARGQVLQVRDLGGTVIETHEYEGHRGVTSEIAGSVEKQTIQYLPAKTIVRDAAGAETVYEWVDVGGWPALGRVTGPCSSCGSVGAETQSWTYDSEGRTTSHTDGAGRTHSYVHNDRGDLVSETNRAGATTTYSYEYGPDDFILKRTVTGPISSWTEAYSNAGITSITEALTDTASRTTTLSYTSAGLLASVRDPRGLTATLTYNGSGDPISVSDDLGPVVQMGYDGSGRRTTTTDPLENTTSFSRDAHGRPTGTVNPDSTITSLTYDKGGRLVTSRDELGRATTRTYDPFGRLEKVTDPAGGTTRYSYDLRSRLTSLTDAEGRTTRFEYDAFGRPVKRVYPGGAAETFSYDQAGRLRTRTDRKGVVMTYGYDAEGRLLSRSSSDGTVSVTYSYDAEGRMTSAANGADTLSFNFDRAGQLRSETSTTNGSTLSYQYDARGSRTSLSLNGEALLSYQHDLRSRLTRIQKGTLLFGFEYDEASRRQRLTLPNGVATDYTYDLNSRLTAITAALAGTALNQVDYAHDGVGNRTQKTLPGLRESYTYDDVDRLTGIRQNGAVTEAYGYDRVGNRLTSLAHPVSRHDENNRLLVLNGTTFAYDPNGNLVSRIEDGDAWEYAWNADNRLVRVKRGGAEVARFAYDPLGRRVEKITGGIATRYLYDGEDILRETVSGTATTYVHGPGIDEPLAKETAGTLTYLHTDGLGSIVKTTNASGDLVSTIRYDAWGNVEQGTPSPHGFTSREHDQETGLVYFRARYLDPKIGRFISEDPIGFEGGENFYSYVASNPTNWTDPSGLQFAPGQGYVPGVGFTTGPIVVPQNYDATWDAAACYSRCVNENLMAPMVSTAAAAATAAANAWATFQRSPGGATEAERWALRRAVAAARQSGGTVTPATVTAAMAAASRGGAAISGATGTAATIAGAAATAAGAGVVLGCAATCLTNACSY